MDGMITGGWEYVWAAYGLSWAGMAAYLASLWMRSRTVGVVE